MNHLLVTLTIALAALTGGIATPATDGINTAHADSQASTVSLTHTASGQGGTLTN